MICPKCGGKNSKEDINCHSCGFKLKTTCPRCKHHNALGRPGCEKCNLTLIRFCPGCKAPNFPHTKNCRKCGHELLKKKKEEKKAEKVEKVEKLPGKPQEKIPEKKEDGGIELKKEVTREEAVKILANLLENNDKGYLVSLCAPEGLGKSMVISTLSQSLSGQKITWLNGICEPYTRNTPYAFFKDLLSNILGLPVFPPDNDEIKKSIKKTLETTLDITDQSVLNVIYKLVLNEYRENNASIQKNLDDTQKALQTLISSLNKKSRLVMIVEDFEYIDKASFDCIKYLLKKNFLDNKNFLIINHTPATNTATLFPSEISLQRMLILLIKPLATPELETVLLSMMTNQDILPPELKSRIFRQSKGLPVYVEQALWYLFQAGAITPGQQGLVFNRQYAGIDINPDLHELFMQRVALVEKISPDATKVILTAGLLGLKFTPKVLELSTGINEKEMRQIIQLVINSGIFAAYDRHNFGFKHLCLWKILFERAFSDEQIKQLSSNVLTALKNNPEVRGSLLAKLAEYSGDLRELPRYYDKAAKEALNLGDTLSYTNNQTGILELLDKTGLPDGEKEAARISITEQVGRVNFEANPALAMDYLKESIKKQEELDNNVKVVELTGYLARSCELAGNYQGVLDCAEKALAITSQDEEESSPETIFLNFSRLDALLGLGRLEETVMTAENEILPFLTGAISKNETFPGLSKDDLKDIEYQCEFTLAKALVYQGNIRAGDLLKKLSARAEKENKPEYELKALLNQALFFTIQGDLASGEDVLEKIIRKDFKSRDSDKLQLEWLFISTIAHILSGDFEKARTICYSALPLAKECRDYNLFALLKLLNGFFYQRFQHVNNAVAIYDEVAHYCSETKMATGALFAWYLAAGAELETGNPDRAGEIAEKALDISKKPNINNFIAEILLSRLIAETKTVRGDFEGAQIYIENGIELAEKNKLTHLLVELYLSFGKIYQENAATKAVNKEQSSNQAYRLYTKALNIAEKLDNHFLISGAEKEISNLQTFCHLSGIALPEGA